MSVVIRVNYNSVQSLVEGLENAAMVLADSGAAAANTVARRATTRSKIEIRQEVNLPADYVEARVKLTQATRGNPVAKIVGRDRPTTLARYNALQVSAPAKRKGAGKGDALRGIPAGMKAGGVSVNVKTGSTRKRLPYAFLIPLRAGKSSGGNGLGVFTRKDGKLRHRYGPSIDQVLRGVWRDMVPDVAKELEVELVKETTENVKRALGVK